MTRPVSDSYTLREVAELLGVSKRTLQRRIREGAFPGRFLAPGRHGLEMRIPAADVLEALDALRYAGEESVPGTGAAEPHAMATVTPSRELADARGSTSPPAALSHSDLVSLRDATLAIVREDRERFLETVREMLGTRDRQLADIHVQLSEITRALRRVQRRLRVRAATPRGRSPSAWESPADVVTPRAAPPPRRVAVSAEDAARQEVDALLQELDALEAMIRSARA